MLDINSLAPLDLTIKDSESNSVKLQDLLGSYVVLYFYPKDDTPGCTAEACSLRDNNQFLIVKGVKIIGVSKDSPESHQKFMQKHKLNFDLWSDEDLEMHKAFGVWVEKSMFGKKYMGAKRVTFVIDPEGKIVKIFDKVKTTTHGDDVVKFFNSIL